MSQISAIAPIHESSYSYERLDTDHQHHLQSLKDYVHSYSMRKYEGSGIKTPQSQSQMPDEVAHKSYDMAVPRTGNDYQPRSEAKAGVQREQLPPLSSLFGGSRPGHAERSPTYPAGSLQGSRQGLSPVRQERQQAWESPYPQRPATSQYAYDTRPALTPNSELPPPPPPRTSHIGRVPESTRPYDQGYSPRDPSQPQASSNRWSPRSTESAYREYLPGGRDTSSFRPHLEQHHSLPPPILGRELENRYREAAITTPSTPTYPPTPASTIISEPVTTKDGLGPKIWTGTQFLPRFVRQAEVPGEGLCYFYDDGTHCKTHIDGEAVNAHWGVTKAGKPRKRLAIACITCREKKIKCDPDYPRCIQCEKFGRICKFKNAPRGGQGSPETPPADVDDLVLRPVSQRSETESYKFEKPNQSRSVSPRTVTQHPSPELESTAAKRRKNGYNDFTPVKNDTEHGYFSQHVSPRIESRAPAPASAPIIPRWPANPFDVDEQYSTELASTYFSNINSTSFAFLPEKAFMRWAINRGIKKSPDDILLIYAILAVATTFSSRPDSNERGVVFSEQSRFTCARQFSLQLVQARLLFSVYFEATGQMDNCWDALGGAIRAGAGLKMNLEQASLSPRFDSSTNAYGLTNSGLAESRRRTFWSCYINDRLGSYRDDRLSSIRAEDIFLRLPCSEESFESQTDVPTPYFETSVTSSQGRFNTMSSMACLVNIATIWGDVMSTTFRKSQRSETSTGSPGENHERGAFPVFYTTIKARLDDWRSALPSHLAYSTHNLEQNATTGYIGNFVTMHTLYLMSHVQLNITAEKSGLLDSSQLRQITTLGIDHAELFLDLMDDVATMKARSRDIGLLSPFIGYASGFALDVLSKSVRYYPTRVPSLKSRLGGALAVLGELSPVWMVVKEQRNQLVDNIETILKSYN